MSTLRCPGCDGRVFNRRRPTCEFCGADLPADLLIPVAEQRARDEERGERDRERIRRTEVEDERQRRQQRRQSSFWSGFGGWF